jgi:hypothetical protein
MSPEAAALADGIDAALPGWVERCVARLATAWAGSVPAPVTAAAASAGQRARKDIVPAIRTLLATDIDEQATTPLAVLRGAVRYPTEVLAAAGVPPVPRDAFVERAFPDDVYDLSPATFADVAPDLGDLGLRWGAAKALEHLRRHRS